MRHVPHSASPSGASSHSRTHSAQSSRCARTIACRSGGEDSNHPRGCGSRQVRPIAVKVPSSPFLRGRPLVSLAAVRCAADWSVRAYQLVVNMRRRGPPPNAACLHRCCALRGVTAGKRSEESMCAESRRSRRGRRAGSQQRSTGRPPGSRRAAPRGCLCPSGASRAERPCLQAGQLSRANTRQQQQQQPRGGAARTAVLVVVGARDHADRACVARQRVQVEGDLEAGDQRLLFPLQATIAMPA